MRNQRLTFEELVIRESRIIATELLERHLTERDLPLPKESALELHVDQLIATYAEIRSTARSRVEARTDTYSESLKALGLTPDPLAGLADIEIEI